MKKTKFLFALIFLGFSIISFGQTAYELKKELSSKKDSIAKLQSKADAIQKQINALPGWRKGAFGTIGASFSGFNNWYSRNAPNASAGNIGITINGFANLIEDKFFWRNSGGINLGWVKLDDEAIVGDEGFETATDVFTITSLYGRRLDKKWAVSALAEYRTTLIDNFNNPGFLDFGVGFTWTPTERLVVVIHPGNYNFVFSKGNADFESSPGAKLVADYTATYHKLNVKSNLSVFTSYNDSNLSNWNWTNSFSYNLWKSLGLGFEFGLRNNKQEALNNALLTDANATFSSVDNKIQNYWLFGVSYAF
ncbi:DUF3078 domain-containing protein [Polaribacter sp.]|uniref:DUF3078 domain-containing protein n=1 Tax=Polaribacter sp. TaxID=1920175 RepID=UPI0040470EDC